MISAHAQLLGSCAQARMVAVEVCGKFIYIGHFHEKEKADSYYMAAKQKYGKLVAMLKNNIPGVL